MPNANVHKKFTACGDIEAEMLLKKVLDGMKEALSGTDLCVVLGGSYGRGDGGVRVDRENGMLYNDLDFFVFARKKCSGDDILLKSIAEKYEDELKIDVDFSRIMSIGEIKSNAPRLMMQELKRGYFPVYGEDLLAENLTELPAAALPFSEACRLLLNRGMGLLLAGEKISGNSSDTDFILRNIYKAILGAGDAMLIAEKKYCWKISERQEMIEKSAIPEEWKNLYREAVDFKHSPNRQKTQDISAFWNMARDFFRAAIRHSAGEAENLYEGFFKRCKECGELSLKNYIKYCIKSHSLPLAAWKYHTMPTVALLAADIFPELDKMPDKLNKEMKLYRHWLIFN